MHNRGWTAQETSSRASVRRLECIYESTVVLDEGHPRLPVLHPCAHTSYGTRVSEGAHTQHPVELSKAGLLLQMVGGERVGHGAAVAADLRCKLELPPGSRVQVMIEISDQSFRSFRPRESAHGQFSWIGATKLRRQPLATIMMNECSDSCARACIPCSTS